MVVTTVLRKRRGCRKERGRRRRRGKRKGEWSY